jgi:hypothetical protein
MTLSVVVTIVDGGPALERCLAALAAQDAVPSLDVIVPWDDTLPDMGAFGSRFPTFRFLPLGAVATTQPPLSAAGQHELFDRRRAAGLGAATGDLVAMLEDRGVPRAGWASALIDLHARLPAGVIGGAVENAREGALNWAVYICDFGRFGLPFAAHASEWLSDINVAYKREVIAGVADLWRDRFRETTVHWALRRSGQVLYLTPEAVVDQMRDDLRIWPLLCERVAWGRLFAHTRADEQTRAMRLAFAAATPLLPGLLFVRHAVQQHRLGRTTRFMTAAPVVLLLLCAWSLGEAIGYITKRS